ncbi:unnamed protein product [Brachionus calyciflorus]|uniref:Uncharacterized protein n=1 Tax=Brachionus calyciflorus TaxID=104777 RepID=A0A814GWJ9_9BILA|nr:unnamed protein product [Brachionus calyciflorus]
MKSFLECQRKKGTNVENFLKIIKEIEVIDKHIDIAQRQRNVYNLNRKNLPDSTILIEIDWKQKIVIGMSPRQISREYRKQQQRTLLGFGIYHRDDNNLIKLINVDIIASFLSQKGKDVVSAFRFLRGQEMFKKIDKKKYIIWTDAGTHFRCADFLHYLFNELANEEIIVQYNIFAEKHGKSSRDQHFSVISNFIRQESFIRKLSCSQDIVDAIHKHQLLSNKNRENKKLDLIETYAFIIEPSSQKKGNIRCIENINNYYNFFNDQEFIFKSTIISDLKKEIIIQFSDKSKAYSKEEIVQNEIKIANDPISIENLEKKLFHIDLLQREKRRKLSNSTEKKNLQSIKLFNKANCKKSCKSCTQQTAIKLSDLDETTSFFRLNQINEELRRHGHAKFKRINGKNRTIEQGKKELRNHLIQFH